MQPCYGTIIYCKSGETISENYKKIDRQGTCPLTICMKKWVFLLACSLANCLIYTPKPHRRAFLEKSIIFPIGLVSLPPLARSEAVDAFSCPSTTSDNFVVHLTRKDPQAEIFLVGSAHISENSARVVERTIRSVRPDVVFLELDEKRIKRVIPTSDIPKTSDKVKYVKEKGTTVTGSLVQYGLTKMYSNLDSAGFESGNEFKVAMVEAVAINAKVVLGDRDVQLTVNSVGAAVRKDFKALISGSQQQDDTLMKLLGSGGETNAKGEVEVDLNKLVEVMKDPKNLIAIMDEFKEEVPNLFEALVGERDIFMGQGERAKRASLVTKECERLIHSCSRASLKCASLRSAQDCFARLKQSAARLLALQERHTLGESSII